jgi:hypothetical protein
LEGFAEVQAQEQALEQKINMDGVALQDAQRNQEIKDAGLDNAKKAAGWLTYYGGMAITISMVALVLSIGAGGSLAVVEIGKAAGRAAMVKANLIYLDKSTGQFPQLLEYLGSGKYSLTDMNDHSTLMLDTRNEADRLAVQGAIAIRHALVLSAAASRSTDPTGVAMVHPLIIEQELEA